MKLSRRPRILVIAALFALSLSLAQAALFYSRRIHAEGTIRTVGLQVYADPECTVVLDSINWGRLEPGQSKNTTFYIKLTGNTPSTLGVSTDNFAPAEAEQYLTLMWDYDGRVLVPGDILKVVSTLQVSSSISGIESFSFDIIITATEAV